MAAPAAGAGAAGAGAHATGSGGAQAGAGTIPGPHLPHGGRDPEDNTDGGGALRWVAAGFAAAVLALLLFIALPAVLFTQQQQCAATGAAEGFADPPTLASLEIARRVYAVGQDMRMTDKQVISAFITVLVESGGGVQMRNLACENPGDCDGSSVGAFQQIDSAPWTSNGRNRRNVRDAARTYFEVARTYDAPGISPGELATRVQRMDARYAHRYLTPQVLARAQHFLDQVKGADDRSVVASVRAVVIAAQIASRAVAPRARAAQAGDGELTLHWPTAVTTITSGFGARSSPCAGCSSMHDGVDIGAPNGAPVHAAADGQVVQRGVLGGYGNYFCLRHRPNLSTCYAHLSRFGAHQIGQRVTAGQVIGYVGATGIGTGPHLHFEVRLSGGTADPAVDPEPILAGAAIPNADAAATPENLADCGQDASGLPDGDAPTSAGPTAELHGTTLSAPATAPSQVKQMIAAGNAIQNLTYTYGGGHNASYRPNPGFDCSASVSYVLHKAGLLDGFPLDSRALTRYGKPGPGNWVTIYANASHTFVMIAGQRLDTSAFGSKANNDRGPRWRGPGPRGDERRFVAVHPPGL